MRPRILIIDDTPDMVRHLAACLRLSQCDYDSAGTVEEAREKLDRGVFNGVTLDMQIPAFDGDESNVANGIAFLKWLREHFSPQELPVIVVTGTYNANSMSEVELIRLGANDYIDKGVDVRTELTEALKRHILAHAPVGNRRLGCAWLAMREDGSHVHWTVTDAGGHAHEPVKLMRKSKLNRLLTVLFTQMDCNGFTTHERLWNECGWTEYAYFQIKDEDSPRNPKQGIAKNRLKELKERFGISHSFEATGIRFFQPEAVAG